MTYQCFDCRVMLEKGYKLIEVIDFPKEDRDSELCDKPGDGRWVLCMQCWEKRGMPARLPFSDTPMQWEMYLRQRIEDAGENLTGNLLDLDAKSLYLILEQVLDRKKARYQGLVKDLNNMFEVYRLDAIEKSLRYALSARIMWEEAKEKLKEHLGEKEED